MGYPAAIRLAVAEDPSVRAFHFYTYPVAIIEGNDPRCRDWILANFIHLAYDDAADESPSLCFDVFDYTINPHLEVIEAQSTWMQQFIGNGLSEFVHEQLARGWYVYLNVDEFYIPNRPHFGRTHYSHDVLVHGSDERSRSIDLLGYDESVRFRSTRASWSELDSAYQSHLRMRLSWGNQFVLYRFSEESAYMLDETFVVAEVTRFLSGANPRHSLQAVRSRRRPHHYGVNALHAYHRELVECRRQGRTLDLHAPQLLFEHSQLMNERVTRLLSPHDDRLREFEDAFRGVVKFTRRLKAAILGAVVLGDYSTVDRLIEEYPDYVDLQSRLLQHAVQSPMDRPRVARPIPPGAAT